MLLKPVIAAAVLYMVGMPFAVGNDIAPCTPALFVPGANIGSGFIQTADGQPAPLRGDEEVCFNPDDDDCKFSRGLAVGTGILFTGLVGGQTCAIALTAKGGTVWGWVDFQHIKQDRQASVSLPWVGNYQRDVWAGDLRITMQDDDFLVEGETNDLAEEGAKKALFRGVGKLTSGFLILENQYSFQGHEKCRLTLRRIGQILVVAEDRFCGPPGAGFSGLYRLVTN